MVPLKIFLVSALVLLVMSFLEFMYWIIGVTEAEGQVAFERVQNMLPHHLRRAPETSLPQDVLLALPFEREKIERAYMILEDSLIPRVTPDILREQLAQLRLNQQRLDGWFRNKNFRIERAVILIRILIEEKRLRQEEDNSHRQQGIEAMAEGLSDVDRLSFLGDIVSENTISAAYSAMGYDFYEATRLQLLRAVEEERVIRQEEEGRAAEEERLFRQEEEDRERLIRQEEEDRAAEEERLIRFFFPI